MRNTLYQLLLIAGSFFVFTACHKSKDDPTLDDRNLTTCEANATCQYLFTENAEVRSSDGVLVPGNYRVFLNTVKHGPMATSLYFKTPRSGNSFTLTNQDVINGKVIFRQSCPTCDYIGMKAVGGEVKGIHKTPNTRADRSRWLIDAKIYLEAVGNAAVKDTLVVKQYFAPNFVFD